MTQIEDMLRTALKTAPQPTTTTPDPLSDLDRRIGRARRRIAAFAVAGVVVVVAAIVVPVSLVSPGHHRRGPIRSVHQPIRQRWAQAAVTGLAAGGGAIWTLEDHPTKNSDRDFVVRRDPATGAVEHRWPVGVEDFIAYGLGRVWVWGGALESGGLSPRERIVAIDPANGARVVKVLPGRVNFQSLAFAAGSAWAPARSRGLLRLTATGDRIAVTSVPIVGSRWVVPISSRGVVVGTAGGGLAEAPTSDLVGRFVRGLTGLAPAPGYGVWTVAGRELTYTARFGNPPSLRLRAPDQVAGVAGDPSTGVYVGLANDEGALNNPFVVYYSPAALRAAHPHPSARLLGTRQTSQVVLDPAGGALVADLDQQLLRWDPAS